MGETLEGTAPPPPMDKQGCPDHDEVTPERGFDAVPGVQFIGRKTAAVDVEVVPDGVSQDQQKYQEQKTDDGETAPDFENESDTGQQLQGRQAHGHQGQQRLGDQIILGDGVGKGPGIEEFNQPRINEDAGQTQSQEMVQPGQASLPTGVRMRPGPAEVAGQGYFPGGSGFDAKARQTDHPVPKSSKFKVKRSFTRNLPLVTGGPKAR